MITTLRDFHLENDTVGLLLDCPLYAEAVEPEWFSDHLLSEAIRYLKANKGREGLRDHLLTKKAGRQLGKDGVLELLTRIRKEARDYAPVTLLPDYAATLLDLYERRLKFEQASEMAREAFAGVAVAG